MQRTAWGGPPGEVTVQSRGSCTTGTAGRSDKNVFVVGGTTIPLPEGDCGTVSDSGLAAETWQQEWLKGAALTWFMSAEDRMTIM